MLLSSFSTEEIDLFKKKKKKRDACTEYTEIYVDKLTGIRRFIAKDKINLNDYDDKNSFDLVWFKSKNEYTLAIKALDKLCFDHDIAVSFHLLQGKVITCPSSHISNCESLMTINFNENIKLGKKIELLSSSDVVGISFKNEKHEYKLKVLQDNSQQFRQTLNCLITRS